LPEPVRGRIVAELSVLASGPTQLSTPARPPYPPGQLYRSDFRVGDVRVLLDVLFQYARDETGFHVLRIYTEFD
jgi:hypothetical protein